MADAGGHRAGLAVGAHRDRVTDIVEAAFPGCSMSRHPARYATSHRLDEIEVRPPGEPPRHLMAKHLGRRALSEAGRLAKPPALDCTERELVVYRDILAGASLDTPALIGGWADHGEGALVVERVEGSPLSEVGDFRTWMATSRWLARMHATFAEDLPETPLSGPRLSLVRYQRDLLSAAGRRGLCRANERGLGSPQVRAALARGHEQAVLTLTSVAPTLVHGDFYPSNIVVSGDRIAVVDWELAGTGPGQLDLAALVAGGWDEEQRHALTRAYHDEATALGPAEPFSVLMQHVRLAILHLSLRWLGSSPGWEVPADHRRDWFTDAVAALDPLDAGAV